MTTTDTLPPSSPVDEIVSLAARLVRIPSRAGIDDVSAVLAAAAAWMGANSLKPRILCDQEGRPVAVVVQVSGRKKGPHLCLNACLDTAPFGDEAKWTRSPISGHIARGKLWGRGAADSKLGAAIIMYVASLVAKNAVQQGTLSILLDADEHSGRFGGVRAFLDDCTSAPDGVLIAYPGHEQLNIGARGYLRARIEISGRSAHSGATIKRGVNAISNLAKLIARLEAAVLPHEPDPQFAFGPSVTVTRIGGGESFSQVPDRAFCEIDLRLTPHFDARRAEEWLNERIAEAGSQESGSGTSVALVDQWPPYVVDEDDWLVRCVSQAARREFHSGFSRQVCGPSNIGNLLATRGIKTLSGLGVGYSNIHAIDEAAEIDDVGPVFRTYLQAATTYLKCAISKST